MLWTKIIQPYLIDFACSSKPIRDQRKKIISDAKGVVLEIGFGSGLNLPFYNKKNIQRIIALEPSVGMQKLALKKIKNIKFEFLTSFADNIPMEDNSIDTVVCTYTLCSISNTKSVLLEIKRVLKKDGKLLIIEHVRSSDYKINRFQNIINPFWKVFAGGCSLVCDTKKELVENGFDSNAIKQINVDGIPKFLSSSILAKLNNIK
tara:strand:+ start:385 stop:999 length:615 start_codon:yes stop_codon:yes gene_type:complete